MSFVGNLSVLLEKPKIFKLNFQVKLTFNTVVEVQGPKTVEVKGVIFQTRCSFKNTPQKDKISSTTSQFGYNSRMEKDI